MTCLSSCVPCGEFSSIAKDVAASWVCAAVGGPNDSNVKEDLDHLDGAEQEVIEEAHALVLLLLPLVVSTVSATRVTGTGSEAASRRAPRGTGW